MRNRAVTGPKYDGKLTGEANWDDGRFAGKHSLRFAKPGSGVRLDIRVDCKQLTLIAWVQLDRAPTQKMRAFLTSDSWHKRGGSVHWDIRDETTFDLDVSTATGGSVKPWTSLFSYPGPSDRWRMFAATYDMNALQGCAYFDGKLVGRETLQNPSVACIDKATIGGFNSSEPTIDNRDRTLGGRIDELVIFQSALSADEIARLRDGMGTGN